MYMTEKDFPKAQTIIETTLRDFLFEPATAETEERIRASLRTALDPWPVQVQLVQFDGNRLHVEVDAPLASGPFKAFDATVGPA